MDVNELATRKGPLTTEETQALRAAVTTAMNPTPDAPPITLDAASYAALVQRGDLTDPTNKALLQAETIARLKALGY